MVQNREPACSGFTIPSLSVSLSTGPICKKMSRSCYYLLTMYVSRMLPSSAFSGAGSSAPPVLSTSLEQALSSTRVSPFTELMEDAPPHPVLDRNFHSIYPFQVLLMAAPAHIPPALHRAYPQFRWHTAYPSAHRNGSGEWCRGPRPKDRRLPICL